jgi:serine protease Do
MEIVMNKYLSGTKKYTNFLVVLSMLLLSSCATVTQSPAPSSTAVTPVDTPAQSMPVTGVTSLETAFEQIYNMVDPSVVNIEILIYSSQSTALGSGFVWDTQGHIVTNNHVIDGADEIRVTFSDGTIVPATVVGTDVDSDLAVIKVDLPADQLKPVQMADSNQIKVGQVVIAIGNPFGFSGTMTNGIVSGLQRTIPAGDSTSTTGPTYSIPAIIQTDAPINPGNSGGVLLDDQGSVIGVTSALVSSVDSSAGIGFAIPSALVQKVIPELIANGKYSHPYLGLTGTSMFPEVAQAMGLDDQQHGALIVDVVTGGPADKAGLKGSNQTATIQGQQYPIGGDIIVGVNEQDVKSFDDLISYMELNSTVGQKLELKVLRQGKEISVEVALGTRPTVVQTSAIGSGDSSQQAVSDSFSGQQAWLGILGVTVSPEIAQAMNLGADQQGLLVEEVQQGSPADSAGIQGSSKEVTINGQTLLVGGDIIIALDENPVTDTQSLVDLLSQYQPDQEVFLTILRGSETIHLSVTLGAYPG